MRGEADRLEIAFGIILHIRSEHRRRHMGSHAARILPKAVLRVATDMFRSSVYISFPNRMDSDRCARPDLSVVSVR
jgi:hypothetical protein